MNEAIVCHPSPVKTLAVSAAPLRELLNFLLYGQNPALLHERARRQPRLDLEKLPTTIQELGVLLGAAKCEKGRKLFFDDAKTASQRGVLIHNFNAQFWVHYFRCGIGLVSVSCFAELAAAEGAVVSAKTCRIGGKEIQWFTHPSDGKFFKKGRSATAVNELAGHFLEQVNPQLINSYLIYGEKTAEPYKLDEREGSCEIAPQAT